MRQNRFTSDIKRRREFRKYVIFSLLSIAAIFGFCKVLLHVVEDQAKVEGNKLVEQHKQIREREMWSTMGIKIKEGRR